MFRRSVAFVALLVLITGCSDPEADPDAASGQDGPVTTTTTDAVRPEGPTAAIGEHLTGGNGTFVASSTRPDAVLAEAGYVQEELVASGTATSYAVDGALTEDGRWTFVPDGEAPYRTRIVVRRPADPAEASGVVVAEWLNVSGGLDADPGWQMLHEDLTRNGDTWVGVSTQVIGINGGAVAVSTPQSEAAGAGRGLRTIDPERYGTLDLPGDGFAFDIFTQVGRALRSGAGLGGIATEHVLASGQSQSAFAMTTYINGVQPLTHAFDGFLVHSRAASALPIAGPGQGVGVIDVISGGPTLLRTDTTVPVFDIQTESDVTGFFGSAGVRQDDTDTLRLWEVAGTAHADRRLVGANVDSLGCGAINDGPMHLVAKAAYRSLVTWVIDGTAPPIAPRLELAGAEQARDVDGIALGGVRTPPVDVPVDVLSSVVAPDAAIICLLSGTTTPLPAGALADRYASPEDYVQRYEASVDEAIEAGFVLAEDREALIAYSDPERFG